MNGDALVVVITGGTHGMGASAALALARLHATLVVVARDAQRGAVFEEQLRRKGASGAWFVAADLSLLAEVRRVADTIRAKHARIDVLINNAAGMFPKRAVTSEGLEKTWALDYLAPMLLSETLAPALEAAPSGRIVNVVSKAAERGRLVLDDLQFERGYSGLAAYARAKLALILGTADLAERHPSLRINCLHPGMVNTGMPHELPIYFRLFVRTFGRFLATADQGAQRLLELAIGEQGATLSGAYFDKDHPVALPAPARDRTLRARLKQVTDSLLQRHAAPTRQDAMG